MFTNASWREPLQRFTAHCDFSKAFLALDLDGTALLEDHGKVFISGSVEKGVKERVRIRIRLLQLPIETQIARNDRNGGERIGRGSFVDHGASSSLPSSAPSSTPRRNMA